MISIYVHADGETKQVDRVEPAWLDPASAVTLWVDLAAPGEPEFRLLSDTFHFHPLAVEDARSALQYPKVEPYPGYLYIVLHGIHQDRGAKGFPTHDVDFFVGRNYLVTVHEGDSRSIAKLRDVCGVHDRAMAEGPVGLLHRIVDLMVDHYRPSIDELEARIDRLEENAFSGRHQIVRQVIKLKHEVATMRRILIPQRDVIARLARREFPMIGDEMAYRFRDVSDHVVRMTEEALLFQDRVTGILEVNLAAVSNRLNQVVKILTVMSTIFLPLTVLTGMWGMNIPLPHFPGGPDAQFWWIAGIMASIIVTMLVFFRRNHWI
jgi:magnesium transporter